MFRNIQSVLGYTIKEHIRNRVYLTVFMFGFIMVAGGLVVSSLAVDERVRVLVNLGLAGIELIALLSIVFVTVNLILEEVESKSIYLILCHPIEKWHYVIGRYLGTLISVCSGMFMMALVHIALLKLYGWQWHWSYAAAVACSVGKVAIVSSLALFISLITTSTASSMILTSFLWIMGHFSSEIKYLGEKSDNSVVKIAVAFFYHLAPDFSVFNYRDYFRSALEVSPMFAPWLFFYTICYVSIMLYLSSWIFSNREF